MTEVDSSAVLEITPNSGVKTIQVVTAATSDSGNTVTVDLTAYGCTKLLGILGFNESTAGSIVITEAPTTAVTSGSLVITLGGTGADDLVRTYIIWAY